MDEALYTSDLDLASVTTREDLAALLRTVHLRADRPSLRTLEMRTRHYETPLSKTVVSEMLKGVRFPRRAVMINFLRACGVHDDHLASWLRAWERIAAGELPQVATPPGRHSDRPRRDTADGTDVARPSLGQSARSSDDVTDPERLREQISKLNADNNRLRKQLVAIRQPAAGSAPQGIDAAGSRSTHSPIASGRELGALLRAFRQEKGLTIGQVADHLMCSVNKVRGMEAGFRAGTLRDVRDLCDLYGVTIGAERERMMKLAEESKQQGWWQPYHLGYDTYVGLEAEAVIISAFQSSVVHGLLQTADYARAGHEGAMPRLSAHQIDMQIEAKLTRQRILTHDNPPRFATVLDEAALHRMFCGRQVMVAQLAKILEMAALPNVAVQVLPYEVGAHPAMESNFTILELPDPTPGVVFVEGLIGSTYLERPEDIKRYLTVFKRLQDIALSPGDTVDFVANLSRSYRNA